MSASGLAKSRAAAFSIVSNSLLIGLKLAAGIVTGSVAILSEALHSGLDLVASVVAWTSVRKADEPADESHHYGHDKFESLAAAFEGVLILIGAALVSVEAVRHLIDAAEVHSLGFGIAVLGISAAVNIGVSARLARVADETGSPALEGDAAHLRTDAWTSLGVMAGLVVVQATGEEWLDPLAALIVAGLVVRAGMRLIKKSSRVLVDEALPADEMDAIRGIVRAFGGRGVAGFHALRARRVGMRRLIDMHIQFRAGTTLEDAHRTAHDLQDEIAAELDGSEVLIHLEPEDRVRPGDEVPPRIG